MSLNRLLRLLAVLLTLATAAMVARIAVVEWGVQERASQGQAAVNDLRVALVAAEMVSRERGPTNGLMGSGSDDQPQRRERLNEARGRTDTAFGALGQVLAGWPADAGHQQASDQFQRAQVALRDARAAVDALAVQPKAQRSPAEIRQRVAAMVAVVPLLAPSVSLLAEEARQALPTLGDDVQGARMAAELREYAGLLGSHFTAALTSQQPFSIDERAAIERTRGRIDQLRSLIDLRLRTPGTAAEAKKAWQDVNDAYFNRAASLVDRVVAAGSSDGRYGMDPAAFAAAYVPDMNSLFGLRDVLLDSAAARAQEQAQRARTVLYFSAGGSVVLLLVLGISLLLVRSRLLKPLVQTAGALQALARDDLQVPLPAPRADDEMAAVIGAVRTLHHSIRQRQALEQERDQLIERLQTLSNTDFLTGLPNRRAFMLAAERDLAQARRQGTDVVLILLDVDHFKKFNDTHGHAAGDAALVTVGEVVRATLRACDLGARLGGEEFVVLLNHSTPAQALAFADRLRAAIAAASVAVPGGHAPVCVTASLGLAVAPSGQVDLDELLQQADQAMYQAKRAGRDRVTLAGAEIEAEAGS
ncbi:MAG: diguanylate cyclase [Rubrivivax sp.]|jgi:diguanylate cyclase (GGDEF)-like protein|nr:diguanylate cyclase [Rubrivivax sp.]